MTHAVVSTGVVKRIGGVTVVDRADFAMPAGQLWGVIGPRGGGRTTLIRLIAGLTQPDEGAVRVFDMDTAESAQTIRPIIGYVPQEIGTYDDLTALENLRLHAELRNLPAELWPARSRDILDLTGLADQADRRTAVLSRAARRRLALGCALVARPRLLLLDEITLGLEPSARRDILQLLRRLTADGTSIFLSTTYADDAEQCDHAMLLADGRLIASGPPRDLTAAVARRALAPLHLPPATGHQPVSGAPTIEVRGLSFRQRGRGLVQDLDLTVAGGEIVGLIGTGKALVFRLLCGLDRPTAGTVEIAGADLATGRGTALARLAHIGTAGSPYPELTPAQILAFFAAAYRMPRWQSEPRIRQLLTGLGLGPAAATRSGSLPVDLQWRVALAAALVHEPALVLLDQPTSDLDPLTHRLVWSDIGAVAAAGIGVLATSHVAEDAERCDRIIAVDLGRSHLRRAAG